MKISIAHLQKYEDTDEISLEQAKEINLVGIIPSGELDPPGTIVHFGGYPFIVEGEATREEFLAAVEASGIPGAFLFRECPAPFFLRIRVVD